MVLKINSSYFCAHYWPGDSINGGAVTFLRASVISGFRRSYLPYSDILRRMVITYRRFGTTYRFHLQGSRKPRRKNVSFRRNSCYISRAMVQAFNGRSVTLNIPARSLGQCRWDLWWTEWQCDRFIFWVLQLFLASVIPPKLYNNLILTLPFFQKVRRAKPGTF